MSGSAAAFPVLVSRTNAPRNFFGGCHPRSFLNLLGRLFRLTGVALLAAAGAWLHGDDVAARVVILANRDDPDSLRLAHYYAEKRGVPESGILALKMPLAETITRPEFVAAIWRPAQDELIRL